MARTPLLSILRRALRQAHAANQRGERADRLAATAGPTRRAVLGAAAFAPLAMACRPVRRAKTQPRVAIVGAGLAGLHCAYRLRQAGIASTVFEASPRTGGRMLTARGKLADGQLCELGGELIDTGHTTLHALAQELDLPLDDLAAASAGYASETFYFDGRVLEPRELSARFQPLAATMARVSAAMDTSAEVRAQIDATPLTTWLTEAGLDEDDVLRRLIEVAYTTEFGLPAAEQSALNLIEFIDFETVDPFRIFGESDERFHVRAGNDAIPTALAARVDDQLALEHALTRVADDADGFVLGFATPNGDIEVRADHVVLALPFSLLRAVDLTALALPRERRQMIAELGYGTNAKLMLQFARRVWHDHGAAGAVFTDASPLQTTWDTSRGQAGTSGVLTNFVGGARGLEIGDGTAEARALEVAGWLEPIYPGIAAAYRPGSALRMHWPTQPWTRGSYACFRPGQAAWADALGARLGRLHFAGEHTSVAAQGFMEGAAESGGRVATEILGDLGRAAPA